MSSIGSLVFYAVSTWLALHVSSIMILGLIQVVPTMDGIHELEN